MDYNKIVECANALGAENTFTPDVLEILAQYSDADEAVIYGLIQLFPDSAFTDEAKEYMNKE